MKLELFQEVALTQDFPEHQLRAGDAATLVDFVPHPSGGEDGCLVEVFNAVGKSIAVVTAPISAVEALSADEILTVRSAYTWYCLRLTPQLAITSQAMRHFLFFFGIECRRTLRLDNHPARTQVLRFDAESCSNLRLQHDSYSFLLELVVVQYRLFQVER